MPKLAKAGNQNLAKSALLAEVDAAQVGEFLEAIHDEEFATSYLFESQMKGYKGWRWSVTLTQIDAKHEATVSEILLLAGPESVVAPKWVPWSERLADYKALQAALEEQARAEAELEAQNASDANEVPQPTEGEATAEAEVDSGKPQRRGKKSVLSTEVAEHDDAEQDADDAAGKPQKRLRWLTRKKRH